MDKILGKTDMNEIKRESKSFEGVQQGVLIALLNSIGFSFEFRRPERYALKTVQYLIINDVYYEGKKLDFGRVINDYCEKQFKTEVKKEMSINQVKTVKRRKDLNRAALTFNWLVDYAEQNGFIVHKRSTKSSKKTLQMEKINEISAGGFIIVSQSQMNQIGKQMNQYIVSQFVKEMKSSTLQPYHPFSTSLMQTNKNQLQIVQAINQINSQVSSTTSIASIISNSNYSNASNNSHLSIGQNTSSVESQDVYETIELPQYRLQFAPIGPYVPYSYVY
ncbi:hypothetical protein EIN_267460 [Entamoeba invadens IP1]|uniref:Uncharacterized protein n=1 Tax=Entamoeba invadens IP1 TaxID=370355 RepID=A0A0A1UE06_ENTIV|nr:hypothetical protein EIN_267460 [Entamoeba invadens IP1]ELP91030.1 hypothetical protein EIN_267460 [Entamoeba invadens IP1]|eukprot:XP_004257801.1 hypothetical protein EIN_267460 [Entamoeba invadens IP1]